MPTIVPDLTAIINQKVLDVARQLGVDETITVIICNKVLTTIEDLASREVPSGLLGLSHLQLLCTREDATCIDVQIWEAGDWERDSTVSEITRKVAMDEQALLVTCDEIQHSIATIEGINVHLESLDVSVPVEKMFSRFFDEGIMSIHLVEGQVPRGKKGKPGSWVLVPVDGEVLDRETLSRLANEILNLASGKGRDRGFLEINYEGAKVVQFQHYRIALAYPPVSKMYEITVTRPLVKLDLDYYQLPRSLVERFTGEADGILIAGPPGAGKSTFASALANFYSRRNFVVKTLESVRDLQVNPDITQYGAIEGEMEKNADMLLLVRPDFTIFDEVRRTRDFNIFVDLRQAGVGMVGVIHASAPIDAIQRFITRVDLGTLPQIIDTVVYIQGGSILDILGIRMVVKIPRGFRDEGLARPVLEVFSYQQAGRILYEIYTFGENTVIIPLDGNGKRNRDRGRRNFHHSHHDASSGYIHGDRGDMTRIEGVKNMKSVVELYPGYRVAGEDIVICTSDGTPVMQGTVSSKGNMRIRKKTPIGNQLSMLLKRGEQLFFHIA